MNVRPILFNTEMVQAILDGRKTQTRRLVKGLNNLNVYHVEPAEDSYKTLSQWDFFYGGRLPGEGLFDAIEPVKAPYAVGDILWVRETWTNIPVSPGGHSRFGGWYYYKADGDIRPEGWQSNWHPSIHMPKEAARIFLRVKDVRVERLQSITVLDAINEGCCGTICDHADADPALGCTDCYNTGWLESPDTEFALLWDTTIKKDDLPVYGWDANPWVWVIEFERCEKPEGWCK